ncbi:hypothetical protein [Nocardioides sp.]|uniref:hypothetical protein n=1 Tax=Nocardioides sp. TaxID=35761 RepID=UPI001A30B820|nr:hypothetical protein [Nocardioides sp.]MBJ7356635.1 hypothetical protein [Nocardioides sp.]
MSVVIRFLLRTVVLAALNALLILAWLSSEAAEDPLGLGLLVFAIYVVVALGWGLVDGVRHGVGPSALVWLLVGLATGALVPLITVIDTGETATLGDDLASTVPFFTLLILVPAVVGIAVGTAIRAVRS